MKPITWAIVIFLLILPIFPGMSQAQGGGGQEYVIQHSDSLWRLAEKYLMDGNFYPLIIKATASKASTDPTFTPINDPNLLYPGQKIWIPDASVTSGTHLTAAGEAPAPAPVTSVTLSLSPSSQPGGHIAFAFWNNAPNRCTYEINIIDVNACLSSSEACQATRRIFALNNASEPALSPDGNNMAFRGWGVIPDELENRSHPYRDCAEPEANRWIQTSTLDATSVLDITGFFEDSHPDWSPDGSRILFDSGRNGDGITRILFVYADGSGDEELQIAGQQPSWAPDNDRFVYRGCDITGNRCGLWLARAIPLKPWEAGPNVIGPILEESEAAQPDWSPVSDEIVYQSPIDGSWDLYLINADGTNKRQLTTTPAVEGLPSWSPDGRWIAYLSNADDNWGIWIIRADGTNARRLFAFDGGIFTPYAVEPYGARDWPDEQISWSR